jgi:hypothetical protein
MSRLRFRRPLRHLLGVKRSFLRLQVFNRGFYLIERKPVPDCRAEFPIALDFFIELGALIAHFRELSLRKGSSRCCATG